MYERYKKHGVLNRWNLIIGNPFHESISIFKISQSKSIDIDWYIFSLWSIDSEWSQKMFRSRIIHIINFCVLYRTSCQKITYKMSGQNTPHRQWEIALVISDFVVNQARIHAGFLDPCLKRVPEVYIFCNAFTSWALIPTRVRPECKLNQLAEFTLQRFNPSTIDGWIHKVGIN